MAPDRDRCAADTTWRAAVDAGLDATRMAASYQLIYVRLMPLLPFTVSGAYTVRLGDKASRKWIRARDKRPRHTVLPSVPVCICR